MKKGEIYVRKVPTVWYFWNCAVKGCEIKPLRSIVEGFVLQAADQHMAKHRSDDEKKQREQVVKARLLPPKRR